MFVCAYKGVCKLDVEVGMWGCLHVDVHRVRCAHI